MLDGTKSPWNIKNYKTKILQDGRYKKKNNAQRRKHASQVCLAIDGPKE